MLFNLLKRSVVLVNNILVYIETLICQGLVIGFAGLLIVNVVMRYVFSAPLYFADELATYMLIWMAFMAVAITIAKQQMIALTFLTELLSYKIQRLLQIIIDLLLLLVCITLTWVSWKWLNSSSIEYDQALTLGVIKKPFYAIVPLFFCLASLHTFSNLLGKLSITKPAELEDLEPGTMS